MMRCTDRTSWQFESACAGKLLDEDKKRARSSRRQTRIARRLHVHLGGGLPWRASQLRRLIWRQKCRRSAALGDCVLYGVASVGWVN